MGDLSVHFATGKDIAATPKDFYQPLVDCYGLTVDAAANADNHVVSRWYGPGGEREDALMARWSILERYWLNPPYSRRAQRQFVDRAVEVALAGGFVVALLPARTDTKLWHECVWSREAQRPHPWVSSLDFVKGRIKFSGMPAGAPFPSAVVIFGR